MLQRTATQFLRKCIIPAGKRVGADLLEFAAPESAEVVSFRKKFKTTAKNVGGQTLIKHLGSGSRKKNARRVIPTISANRASRSRNREETFSRTFPINHVKQFSVPAFCGASWMYRRKSPVVDVLSSTNKKYILMPHSMETA